MALVSFFVLTRLPAPQRAPAELATRFLESRFPDPPLALAPETHLTLLAELTRAGLGGGAVYDAAVAAAARDAGALLVAR